MQVTGFLLDLLLFHYAFLHNQSSYFFDNRPCFCCIFIDDIGLNLCTVLLLGVG